MPFPWLSCRPCPSPSAAWSAPFPLAALAARGKGADQAAEGDGQGRQDSQGDGGSGEFEGKSHGYAEAKLFYAVYFQSVRRAVQQLDSLMYVGDSYMVRFLGFMEAVP